MMWLIGMALGYFAIRFFIVVANYISNPVLQLNGRSSGQSLVSVLIPARNESGNIDRLLASLAKQHDAVLEILVLDDHSEDNTTAVVQQAAMDDRRIRLLRGKELPHGWVGKNWACHQLASEAQGNYFLFLDADVEVEVGLTGALIHECENKKLALLSVFPRQQMVTMGEKVVVPIMNFLLLSLLPLRLVYSSSHASLAAANGQCMFFHGETYRKFQWHESVKNNVAEDIQIMKAVKRSRLKGEVQLANEGIQCRMYRKFGDAVSGFRKNLPEIFAGSRWFMMMHILLSLVLFPLAAWYFPVMVSVALCLLIVLMRFAISVLSGQSPVMNALLHPVQMMSLFVIAFLALGSQWKGSTTWKGRRVKM